MRIPTLQEYARVCKRYGKVSVLELKDDFTRAQLEEIIAILRAEGQLENVVFIAFALENLLRLREILPEQPAQYLVSRMEEGVEQALLAHGLDLDAHYAAVDAALVQRLHAHGRKVNCWTVDAPEEARRLVAMAWIISPAISWKAATDSAAFAPVAGFPQNGLTRLKTPRELTFNTDCDTVRLGDTI